MSDGASILRTDAWRAHWRGHSVDFCEKGDATPSTLACIEATDPKLRRAGKAAEEQDDDDDDDDSSSSSSDSNGGGGSSSSSKDATVWYCEGHKLHVNTSAISLGSSDLTVPTSNQKGLWKHRALLLDCPLDTSALERPKRFGMLSKQLLPSALASLPHGAAFDAARESFAAGIPTADAATTVVFIARYSVKNFFLAHFDLLQVASILLHALGPDLGRDSTQLVFLPPDKANQGWWGPHKPLWATLSKREPLSYAEWLAASKDHRGGATSRLITIPAPESGGSRRRSGGGGQQPSLLIPVQRAIFALSGHHSVYGRGLIGRGIEKACGKCDTTSKAKARVSAFYRVLLNTAVSIPRSLAQHVSGSAARAVGLWISRGRGLGNGYGNKVGRRCLNEAEVLQSIRDSDVKITLTSLELSGMPFAEQLSHFRKSNVMTGMHGAGYANLIFLKPGGVVAELCPLGYCTPSYIRLSKYVGLSYIRWTNSIAENAKAGYDTIVDTKQFVGLMKQAVRAWRKGPASVRPNSY